MEQHLIFPTQVFVDSYDCGSDIREILNNIPMRQNSDDEYNNSYGTYTKSTYILSIDELSTLRNELTVRAHSVMYYGMCFDVPEGVYITQSWISLKKPGQSHSAHTHTNSILTGVYYYDDLEDLAPISFHKDEVTHGVFKMDVHPDLDRAQGNIACGNIYTYKPKKNDILFFPSYLKHSVAINDSSVDRKCLAFNVIPNYGFGIKGGLNELRLA